MFRCVGEKGVGVGRRERDWSTVTAAEKSKREHLVSWTAQRIKENLKCKTRQHSLVKDSLNLSISWEVEEIFGLRGSCDFDFAGQRGCSAWKSRVHGRVRSALDWQASTGILQGSDSRLLAT